MAIELWKLSVPMTSLVIGPDFTVSPKRQCEIAFSVEDDGGNVAKIRLTFEAVEAFKCTYMTSLSAGIIDVAYGKLVDVGASQWLSESKETSTGYYVRAKRPLPNLKHLMICFDDGPCYEFICVDFNASAPSGL